MHELQGDTIPVYLGSFNLRDTYFLAFRVYIVYMMLMSWAGEFIDEATVDSAAVPYAVDDITRIGVKHGDLRAPNILWNAERQRVMVIDFERSRAMAKVTEKAPPKTLVPLVGSEQATCPAICQSPWTSWLASPRGPTGHHPGSGTKSYQLDGEAGIPTLRGWPGRKYRKTVGAHENGRRRSASNIVCP